LVHGALFSPSLPVLCRLTPVTEEPRPHPDPLGDFLREQRRLAQMSLRQLSELAKVSNPYLSQVERGLYKPSAQVLKSIADALHISAEQLYQRAGLLDEEAGKDMPTVEEAIRLDEALTPEQKDTLLRVYHSFVRRGSD
jgi:transcriptional regulator with XRE-family HTH domain